MSSTKPILVCFPGFLGLKADFDFLRQADFEVEVVEVCGKDGPLLSQTWEAWEAQLLKKLLQKFSPHGCILVGYSMGARIALSILAQNPLWIKAAVLISGRPALENDREKFDRANNDAYWAKRFHEDGWKNLIKDWNQQAVFSESIQPIREEKNYRRSILKNVLQTFSLSNQKPLGLSQIAIPTLICWGEKDTKCKDMTPSLLGGFQKVQSLEVPNAGHRVMLDNPEFLSVRIKEFVSTV